jgi:hypothetical protein
LASALPYPIPWYLVPLNVYFILYIIMYMKLFNPTKALATYIKSEVGAELLTLSRLNQSPPPGVKYLVANQPELEFPIRIPPHILPCGPIIRPATPVTSSDPDLARWLAKGPTMYVNLGTQVQTTEWDALEIARALKQVLIKAGTHKDVWMRDVQVLWKLNKRGNYSTAAGSRIHNILGCEIDNGRVQVVSWVIPEPSAVLAEESVVCSVHHGGANSFLEAAR